MEFPVAMPAIMARRKGANGILMALTYEIRREKCVEMIYYST